MALFKGEITYKELLWEIPYKQVQELIRSRQDRMIEEEKMIEEQRVNQERENIRSSIMTP